MRVFELRYPGTWLDGMSPEQAHQVQGMLYLLESYLADAAMALALFEGIQRPQRRAPTPEDWRRGVDETGAMERELERQLPPTLSQEDLQRAREEIRERAAAQVRRRAWAAGRVPDSYERRLPFIYAHAVLFALDQIGKALGEFADLPEVPRPVADACAGFEAALPSVLDVRNSAHHVEDRVRGMAKGEKPITLKPVDTPEIKAPGGVLVLSSLLGNRLSYTTADGSLGQVEIGPTTVATAQQIVQRVLDAFAWRGPARVVPN